MVSKKRLTPGMISIYVIFGILLLITFIPFLIMIVNAGRTQSEISTTVTLIPGDQYVANFKMLVDFVPILQGFINSVFVSTLATAITIYFSTMVAYGFVVYNFKHREKLFYFVLATMMIPGQLTFIGFYDVIKNMGLLNSFIPLIIPGIASASTVYFLRQYGQQVIDKGIIESARMDNAGEFRIFHRIVMPILTPAMSTMAIFTFIYNWNNYMMPLILLNSPDKFTLPLLIRYVSTLNPQNIGVGANMDGITYLAILISVVPIVIVYAIFSKKIVNGLTAGSVK